MWEERAYMDYLLASFKEHGHRVPDLMRAIALSDNFFAIRQPEQDAAEQNSEQQQAAVAAEPEDRT
jgi:hypothetical protein